MHHGEWGFYAGGSAVADQGFRERSPAHLRQGYLDLGHESERLRWHLGAALAHNDLHGLGPTPVELLRADPAAVFTAPQAVENGAQLVQLSATFAPTPRASLSGSLYSRHFLQHLIDGNTSEVSACANDAAYLCLGGTQRFPADLLYGADGAAVPSSILPPGATPGETSFTRTETDTSGAALQFGLTAPLLGLDNSLLLGASLDASRTRYDAEARLGELLPDLTVLSTATVIDQSLSPTATPPLLQPVAVRALTAYTGLYLSDTLRASAALAVTVSARFNDAQVRLEDLRGAALDGTHRFTRLNPGAGLTYRIGAGVTVYAGYSEANRAPTAGELSCADPRAPCALDAFLVSHPPLRQVIARTLEAGVRGELGAAGVARWYATLFRTQNRDDIILLATALNGFGYFANAGSTRRQGMELGLSWRHDPWRASLGYSRIEATFRQGLRLASNSPAADAGGNIFVPPGVTLPLNPRDRLTAGLDYEAARGLSAGIDLRYSSSQFLAGDESNQEAPLPAYALLTCMPPGRCGPR